MNVITKTTSVAVLVTLGLALAAGGAGLPTRDSTVESQTVRLDGPDWRVAADGKNAGRQEKWFESARPDAKPTSVPGVVQNVFAGFHGPAWYYRDFDAPVHPHENGRYFLRFGAVDWTAEVWVNGQPIGKHENGENPFTVEATAFRSLPGLVGLCPTQKISDQDYDGGGLTTFFREYADQHRSPRHRQGARTRHERHPQPPRKR